MYNTWTAHSKKLRAKANKLKPEQVYEWIRKQNNSSIASCPTRAAPLPYYIWIDEPLLNKYEDLFLLHV